MKCEEVRESAYLYLDGEMEETRSKELADHLLQCVCCRNEIGLDKAAIRTVRERAPRHLAPAELRMKIAEVFHPAPVSDLFLGWFTRRRLTLLTAAAVMAVMVLGVFYWMGGRQRYDADGVPGIALQQGPIPAAERAGFQAGPSKGFGKIFHVAGLAGWGRIRAFHTEGRLWKAGGGRDPDQLKLKSLRQRSAQVRPERMYIAHGRSLTIAAPEFASAEDDGPEVTDLAVQEQPGYFLPDE